MNVNAVIKGIDRCGTLQWVIYSFYLLRTRGPPWPTDVLNSPLFWKDFVDRLFARRGRRSYGASTELDMNGTCLVRLLAGQRSRCARSYWIGIDEGWYTRWDDATENCPPDDTKIGKGSGLAHIAEIELYLLRLNMLRVKSVDLLPVNVAQDLFFAAEGDGCQSSDSRPVRHVEDCSILRQLWPRADEAHIATEDVVKLR